jgi:hypothetical protein
MTIVQHPHAVFDRFPPLVRETSSRIRKWWELSAVVERFIAAQKADFSWKAAARNRATIDIVRSHRR